LLQAGKEEAREIFESLVVTAAREAIVRVALAEVDALCGPRYEVSTLLEHLAAWLRMCDNGGEPIGSGVL
jgi:hypothetical protein